MAWSNLNQISVRFDRAASVDATDLVITGVNVEIYGVASFAYDAATFTATWTLNRTIPDDKVTFSLDLDTAPGADFVYTARVLPGDIDRNGIVSTSDFNIWKSNFGQQGKGVLFGDIDGNNIVSTSDFNAWKSFFGKTAPA
jgi:hypothetical protein